MRGLLSITAIILLSTGQAYAESEYMKEYNKPENKYRFKEKYGNAPYFFSDKARSKYSYSGEEKGHYILGETDKPWPFDRLKK